MSKLCSEPFYHCENIENFFRYFSNERIEDNKDEVTIEKDMNLNKEIIWNIF